MEKYINDIAKLWEKYQSIEYCKRGVPVFAMLYDINGNLINQNWNERSKPGKYIKHAEFITAIQNEIMPNCTMVISTTPCSLCLKKLEEKGIKKIIILFMNHYKKNRGYIEKSPIKIEYAKLSDFSKENLKKILPINYEFIKHQNKIKSKVRKIQWCIIKMKSFTYKENEKLHKKCCNGQIKSTK